MTNAKSALIKAFAAAAIGISGVSFATPASAQAAAGPTPRGWFKVCAKQEDNDICNTQNIITADSGQLLTALSLIDVKGKVTKKILQISVPTGRLIPAGIGMQIGQNKPTKVEYAICFPDRCIAEAVLSNELIAAMKKGADMTLTSVNFQNKPNPLKISLSGFGAAFDGPGLKQSELEEQNKKLQDEMVKRKEEFEKKLKAEQDKAKAASGG